MKASNSVDVMNKAMCWWIYGESCMELLESDTKTIEVTICLFSWWWCKSLVFMIHQWYVYLADIIGFKDDGVSHRCPFPIGWLISIRGFEETPLTTGFYDDRWYMMVYQTSPSIFAKRTLLVSCFSLMKIGENYREMDKAGEVWGLWSLCCLVFVCSSSYVNLFTIRQMVIV